MMEPYGAPGWSPLSRAVEPNPARGTIISSLGTVDASSACHRQDVSLDTTACATACVAAVLLTEGRWPPPLGGVAALVRSAGRNAAARGAVAPGACVSVAGSMITDLVHESPARSSFATHPERPMSFDERARNSRERSRRSTQM